jgi:hypothetical protein
MKVRFPDESQSYLDSASVEGGSFNSFFKHLGRDIKHVGSTALNVAKSGVNYAEEHPELAALALGGGVSGGAVHQKHFNKQLDDLVREKQMTGGRFSISGLAKKAYSNASKIAKNEVNKTKRAITKEYENNIKPDIIKARNRVSKDIKDKYNDGYDRIKSGIREAYEGPSKPKQSMMQPDDSLMDDMPEEVGAGIRRKTKKGRSAKTARGALISKLIKQHGFSLGEASHYIKSHNLM